MISMGNPDERNRDVDRKREQRESAREVVIPKCADRRRRKRLEGNDVAWLRWYFDDPADPLHMRFWYDFTLQQLEMIEAIRHAIVYGGDQSLAASRGEGKTTIFERVMLKYVLQGVVSFGVLLAATGTNAEDILESIKQTIEENDRLAADYPEVCAPVRALENTPNRAHYQLATGHRHDNGKPYKRVASRFSWCGREIVLPQVPGSPAAGAIIATRGLDSAVRGLRKKNRRVDIVGIDDPDTEESVNSEEQAMKLERRIDRAVAGLGGQQRRAARVMLTTLQNRTCVSARFTDPKQKPSWHGKRFRFLLEKPARMDLWEDYIELWKLDHEAEDTLMSQSRAFYAENRAKMDDGAEVANPLRFTPTELPDGSQLEMSALQFYFNEVARLGPEAVRTEYDNDPPEDIGMQDSGLSARRIQTQVSGYGRKVVPPGCAFITQGIDVSKIAMHWVVRAWAVDGNGQLVSGYTIDYNVQDVWGTTVGSDEGVDDAIKQAVRARRAQVDSSPYVDQDGNVHKIDLTLIDAGYRTEAVYDACREMGPSWKPAMGFGRSNGCVKVSFSMPSRATGDKKIGHRWFLSRQPSGIWLACTDADYWKGWEHDRWLTDPNNPGAMLIYGQPSERRERLSLDEKGHMSYAKHVTAEVEVEDVVKGVIRRFWRNKSDTNHYLDASYMSDVAANMLGLRMTSGTHAKRKSVKLSDLQAAKSGR